MYPARSPEVLATIERAREEATRRDLQIAAGMRDRKHFRESILNPCLQAGLLEMTIPDKPRSNKQRYRLTDGGKAFLEDNDTR